MLGPTLTPGNYAAAEPASASSARSDGRSTGLAIRVHRVHRTGARSAAPRVRRRQPSDLPSPPARSTSRTWWNASTPSARRMNPDAGSPEDVATGRIPRRSA